MSATVVVVLDQISQSCQDTEYPCHLAPACQIKDLTACSSAGMQSPEVLEYLYRLARLVRKMPSSL